MESLGCLSLVICTIGSFKTKFPKDPLYLSLYLVVDSEVLSTNPNSRTTFTTYILSKAKVRFENMATMLHDSNISLAGIAMFPRDETSDQTTEEQLIAQRLAKEAEDAKLSRDEQDQETASKINRLEISNSSLSRKQMQLEKDLDDAETKLRNLQTSTTTQIEDLKKSATALTESNAALTRSKATLEEDKRRLETSKETQRKELETANSLTFSLKIAPDNNLPLDFDGAEVAIVDYCDTRALIFPEGRLSNLMKNLKEIVSLDSNMLSYT